MADDGLTCDGFLGGQLRIFQPAKGYRAGVDPVLLAASVTARTGDSVLELGCGVGVAGLCLQSRVGGLDLVGLELQPENAELARRNASGNGLSMDVVTGDLSQMPGGLRARNFDHVIANPPYYLRDSGTAASGAAREIALGEVLPLSAWVDAATRRLKPRGVLTMIQRADRLIDLLSACDGRLGDIAVQPLAPRVGRAAELVLLRARKGARGPFRLHSPIVLHSGEKHERDGDSYTPEIRGVLRDGMSLPTGWHAEIG